MSAWLRGQWRSALYSTSLSGLWQTPYLGALDPEIPNLPISLGPEPAIPERIQFVGSGSGAAGNATISVSLTSLTGGIGTTALENDIVVAIHSNESLSSDENMGPSTSGYTELADLFANDFRRANLSVSWKRMGSTPDTNVNFPGLGVLTDHNAIVRVYRNVDTITAIDVTSTTATNTNTNQAVPPSIGPLTPGSWVVSVLNQTVSGTVSSLPFPSPLQHAVEQTGGGVYTASGDIPWGGTPATVTPPQWPGQADSLDDSWAAITLALRPKPSAAAEALGTLAATLGAVTVSSAGTARANGTLAATLGEVSVSSTGTVAAAGAIGDLAVTLGAVTVSSAGTARANGTLAVTLGAVTVSSAGTARANGTASITLGAVTPSSAGTARANGTLAVTLGAVTVSSAGTARANGTLAATLGAVTVSSAGTVSDGVNGTLAATLGDVTAAAAGTARANGTLAVTLGAIGLFISPTPVAPSYSHWLKMKNKNKPKAPTLPPPLEAGEVVVDEAFLRQMEEERIAALVLKAKQEALRRIEEFRVNAPDKPASKAVTLARKAVEALPEDPARYIKLARPEPPATKPVAPRTVNLNRERFDVVDPTPEARTRVVTLFRPPPKEPLVEPIKGSITVRALGPRHLPEPDIRKARTISLRRSSNRTAQTG